MNADNLHAGEEKTELQDLARDERLPKDVLLRWPGKLSRFSRALEGGPGTPRTLFIMAVLAAAMAWQGARMVDRSGIDGAGPALVLLGGAWLLFLLVWVLSKAGLRDPSVVFYVTEQGAGILPSARQRSTDQGVGCLMWLVFLVTFKGGQWSAWHPFTRWKEVRRVGTNDLTRHVLISGGTWDVRLVCEPDNYDAVKAMIRERLLAAKARCIFTGVERL